MKIILLNGSPRKECTYTALKIIADEIEKNGIETEIYNIGKKAISGCIACGSCKKTGKCAIDDGVNEFIEKMKKADGLIVGTPVHYASASGAVTSFMDRAAFSGGKYLMYKPAAAVASCRRGGASVSLDQINKYFGILNMPVVSSNYWNMVHGSCADDIYKDEEGVQTMRILGKNISWIVKLIENGKKDGILHPEPEVKVMTSYIR